MLQQKVCFQYIQYNKIAGHKTLKNVNIKGNEKDIHVYIYIYIYVYIYICIYVYMYTETINETVYSLSGYKEQRAVHGLLMLFNLRRIWPEVIYYSVLLQLAGMFSCIRNVLLYLSL